MVVHEVGGCRAAIEHAISVKLQADSIKHYAALSTHVELIKTAELDLLSAS